MCLSADHEASGGPPRPRNLKGKEPEQNKVQTRQTVSECRLFQLQSAVAELKAGFGSALLELGQIQHGDLYLREELQESRRSCRDKALRLEALVEALRVRRSVRRPPLWRGGQSGNRCGHFQEELEAMRSQVLQLHSSGAQPEAKKQTQR